MDQHLNTRLHILYAAAGICALGALGGAANHLPIITCLFLGLCGVLLVCIRYLQGGFTNAFLVEFALFVSICGPYLRGLPGIPAIRPEYFLLAAIVAVSTLARSFKVGETPGWKFPFLGYAIIAVSGVLIPGIYGALSKGTVLSFRDAWEPLKLLIFYGMFVFSVSARLDARSVERLIDAFVVFSVFSFGIALIQYIDVSGFGAFIASYYAPTQLRSLLAGRRVVGTFPNPNEFGAYLIVSLTVILVAFFQIKRRNKKVFYLLSGLLCFVGLILTGSRSALAGFLVSAGVIFVRRFWGGSSRDRMQLLLTVGSVAILGILILGSVVPRETLDRMLGLLNPLEQTSFLSRLNSWNQAYAAWMESPLFGWGPAKFEMTTIVDNEWLLMLRRYGIVGTLLLCLFFGRIAYACNRRRHSVLDSFRILAEAAVPAASGIAVYMVAAAFIHSMQLMSILVILSGVTLSSGHDRSRAIN